MKLELRQECQDYPCPICKRPYSEIIHNAEQIIEDGGMICPRCIRAWAGPVLILHLRRRWWEDIRDGRKVFEYRRATEYWRKRLIGRTYSAVELHLGYPTGGSDERIIRRPWRATRIETITHPEFGASPVEVIVIDVRGEIA